jgi:hypothetical protein
MQGGRKVSSVHKAKHKQPLRIFLSHSSSDSFYATKLREILLRRPEVSVFSTEMLSAGEDWKSKLKDELFKCDIFSILLSPNSVDSKWVLQELGAAWALEKPIVPIVTSPALFSKIPVALSHAHAIDIKDIDKPGVIDRLLENYEGDVAASGNGG